ncbi:MAG: hypothetical protein K2K79_08110 [Paramuribaculum sp.]|nr:hypothetical protein [Paramuribaculum sp.]
MDKDQISNLLKEITPSAKLPSHMEFEVSGDCLFITVSERGVVGNMQEDRSAFEGWAVVIKAAYTKVNKVILDWKDPLYNPEKKNAETKHYNRFVMRVANFRKGYSWFDVADHRKNEVDAMQNRLQNEPLFVNYPKTPLKQYVDKEKKPEAFRERELVKSWSKSGIITDEQLPVGIFDKEVCIDNTLTPRGASQIDLWQLYDNTMHVYELKVRGNESIGIISELMFYACTIQNIVDGLIKYPDLTKAKPYRHFKDFANAVQNRSINTVKGYFTSSKFHPLIESHLLKNTIIDILNANTFGIVFEYKYIPD